MCESANHCIHRWSSNISLAKDQFCLLTWLWRNFSYFTQLRNRWETNSRKDTNSPHATTPKFRGQDEIDTGILTIRTELLKFVIKMPMERKSNQFEQREIVGGKWKLSYAYRQEATDKVAWWKLWVRATLEETAWSVSKIWEGLYPQMWQICLNHTTHQGGAVEYNSSPMSNLSSSKCSASYIYTNSMPKK